MDKTDSSPMAQLANTLISQKENRDVAEASDLPKRDTSKECDGCFYWRGGSLMAKSCCYIFMEDHSRGCEPGRDCNRRIEKRKDERL